MSLVVIPQLTQRQEEVLLALANAAGDGLALRGPEKRVGLCLGRKGLASWLPSERRYFLTSRGRDVAEALTEAHGQAAA